MPLPDEGIKIAALPAASSPDAIDLVGVQAGVTKKLASTLLATQAELDAVNAAAAHLAGAETITGAKTFTSDVKLTGENTALSVDAGGARRLGIVKKVGADPMFAMGSGTDMVFAVSSGAGVDASNGFTEQMRLSAAGDLTIAKNPATGTQSGLVANFSFIGIRRFDAGAVDSAGAGFRTVRIPN